MPASHRHLSVDELSHRASTGLAIRRGDIKISDPIPSSYVHHGIERDQAYEQRTPRMDTTVSWSGRSGPGALHGRSGSAPLSSHPAHSSKFTERTSLGPSLSTSNMSSTPLKGSPMPKKDIGFRASLKRMFSKKSAAATAQKRSAHQSDLGRVPVEGNPHKENHFRTASTHFAVATPGRPLQSHATKTHRNVDSIDAVEQSPELDQFGKKRNTVPELSVDLIGSSEGAEYRQLDSLQIRPAPRRPGTAVKRDPLSTPHLNRRSRSADALIDLLRSPASRASDRRDRSEEIAFWRNSVVLDPLPQMPPIESTTSVNSLRDEPLPGQVLSRQPRPSIEPVQDFDFGLNAPLNSTRSATLQERVNTLEVKLVDFEYALAKLQGNDIIRPSFPQKPARQKSNHDVFAESADSSSSTNGTSTRSSPRDGWRPSSPLPQAQLQCKQDRTSKATTIKPTHRRRPSSRSQISNASIHITRSQYDALRGLIEDEKNARQKLEIQVGNLQQQVDTLRTPVQSYIRPAQYPTPSPDSFHDSGAVATTARPPQSSPALRQEKHYNETSRFSMSETEPETEVDTDDPNDPGGISPDTFETPQENNFRFEPATMTSSGMF